MATQKPELIESDIWANQGTPTDVIKPDQPKINSGFQFGEKPPHSGHNFYWQLFSQFLVALNQNGVPEWDSVTNYNKGALAKDGDLIYQALVTNVNVPPSTDPGIWGATTLLEQPERGGVIWQYALTYKAGDISVENFIAYIALRDNSNRQPSTNPSDWKLIIDLSYLDSRFVNVSGDTMTGNLNVPSLNNGQPWLDTNDGAGSGLDADKLDGMQPLELPISNPTQDALNQKLPIDGKAVDSDKLDGMEPINLPISNPTQDALDTKPTGAWSFDGQVLYITIP